MYDGVSCYLNLPSRRFLDRSRGQNNNNNDKDNNNDNSNNNNNDTTTTTTTNNNNNNNGILTKRVPQMYSRAPRVVQEKKRKAAFRLGQYK